MINEEIYSYINDVIIDEVVVYGNFATHSKDENKYEFNYSDLDKLCKKYK